VLTEYPESEQLVCQGELEQLEFQIKLELMVFPMHSILRQHCKFQSYYVSQVK